MKDYIIRYVKSIGVLISLRTKVLHGVLDYYFIDWIGKDSQYYSLFVIANESQIFTRNVLALGNAESSLSCLSANLKQFDNKTDWVIDKWDLKLADKYDAFIKEHVMSKSLDTCDTTNYRVVSFSIVMRPIAQYVVCYEFNSTLHTLIISSTKSEALTSRSLEETEFLMNVLASLGLENKFTIKENF